MESVRLTLCHATEIRLQYHVIYGTVGAGSIIMLEADPPRKQDGSAAVRGLDRVKFHRAYPLFGPGLLLTMLHPWLPHAALLLAIGFSCRRSSTTRENRGATEVPSS